LVKAVRAVDTITASLIILSSVGLLNVRFVVRYYYRLAPLLTGSNNDYSVPS